MLCLKNKSPKLSIIVPAFQEADVLTKNICIIDKMATKIVDSYEIIISEEGNSYKETTNSKNHFDNLKSVKHLYSEIRLGKGASIMKAIKKSEGKIIFIMDADLSTNLRHMKEGIQLLENGFDIVIGSRHVSGAEVKRPLKREIASRAYNLLVNFLFLDGISDHQCGFKGFNRNILNNILQQMKENGYIFDTELIIRAKRKNIKLIEIPVTWREPEDRLSKFKLFRDGTRMLIDLAKLRIKLYYE